MNIWEKLENGSLSEVEKSILKILHGSSNYVTRNDVLRKLPKPKPTVEFVGLRLSNLFHDGFCMRDQNIVNKRLISFYALAPKGTKAISRLKLFC